MEALRARFLARCREDLAVLRSGADASQRAAVVHRLAGSAGSFGLPGISAVAASIDGRSREGRPPSGQEVEVLIRALEAELAAERSSLAGPPRSVSGDGFASD